MGKVPESVRSLVVYVMAAVFRSNVAGAFCCLITRLVTLTPDAGYPVPDTNLNCNCVSRWLKMNDKGGQSLSFRKPGR